MIDIEFIKLLLEKFNNCPSEKSLKCRIVSIKDECFKTAKEFNFYYKQNLSANQKQLSLSSQE